MRRIASYTFAINTPKIVPDNRALYTNGKEPDGQLPMRMVSGMSAFQDCGNLEPFIELRRRDGGVVAAVICPKEHLDFAVAGIRHTAFAGLGFPYLDGVCGIFRFDQLFEFRHIKSSSKLMLIFLASPTVIFPA